MKLKRWLLRKRYEPSSHQMKNISLILSLLLIVFGCDQGQKMVAPVMDDVHVSVKEPTTPPATVEEVIQEMTFDNVSSLQVGKKYRMRPTGISDAPTDDGGRTISIYFGSLTEYPPVKLLPHLPTDTPKVAAHFQMDPAHYAATLDGEPVIGWTEGDPIVYDEIVIEIKGTDIPVEMTSSGGRGNEPFTYDFLTYFAVVIENLTNPDRKIEYE